MRRMMVASALAAALLGLGCRVFEGRAFAADWALTVDTPLSYTFNGASATTGSQGGNTPWHNRTTTEVSGSKVLLIAPFHVGVGYEDYSVAQKLDFSAGGGVTGVGKAVTNLRISDLALDIPMKFLNLTAGYGSGSADSRFTALTPPNQPSPLPIRNANVSQYFLTAGIPFGQRIDLHVGYHWVTVESKDLLNASGSAPFSKANLSGQMVSAGLRLNF